MRRFGRSQCLGWALVATALGACVSVATPSPERAAAPQVASALVVQAAKLADAAAERRVAQVQAAFAKLLTEGLRAARSVVADADRAALSGDEVDCLVWLTTQDVSFELVTDHVAERPRRARDTCTIEQPIRLGGRIGAVQFSRDDMLMSCELARRMVRLSALLEARDVVEVDIAAPFHCETLPRRRTISQHGHGNALDVSAVRTASGEEIPIEDWERRDPTPESEGGRLWYDLVHQLYEDEVFNIILTPDYDRAHRHWLHLDLTPEQHFLR